VILNWTEHVSLKGIGGGVLKAFWKLGRLRDYKRKSRLSRGRNISRSGRAFRVVIPIALDLPPREPVIS